MCNAYAMTIPPALLTVDAGPDILPMHHRQPAVVAPADCEEWLDETRPAPPLKPSAPGQFTVTTA
jgi:putative SOS response-associated peptidase YedK